MGGSVRTKRLSQAMEETSKAADGFWLFVFHRFQTQLSSSDMFMIHPFAWKLRKIQLVVSIFFVFIIPKMGKIPVLTIFFVQMGGKLNHQPEILSSAPAGWTEELYPRGWSRLSNEAGPGRETGVNQQLLLESEMLAFCMVLRGSGCLLTGYM